MSKKEYQTAAQVTDAMIKEWEGKFNCKVRIIRVPREEGPAKFFLRKPERTVISQITKLNAEKDFEKGNLTLIKNCVLGGDMQYLDMEEEGGEDGVYYAVLDAIGELVEKKKATFLN